MIEMTAVCLALGAVAGFFAGLFGIGAGILMVPVMHEIFLRQELPGDLALRLALGTSMAGIIFNSLSSLRAHHRHGAVLWPVVVRIAPGVIAGTLVGTQIVAMLPLRVLAIAFVALLVLIALQMAFELRPSARRALPGTQGLVAVGTGIGMVMSVIAGGGGMLTTPFLVWCNVDMRKAIGTAAAVGFPIAVSGTLGFVIAGERAGALPPWSLGYVFVPALLATAATSSLTAPIGARMTHRLPLRVLRRGFAVLLILVAIRMIDSTL
jgi:uncharacterized membrane protein YfcA